MLVKADRHFIKHMNTTDAAVFAGWQSTGSSLSAQFELGDRYQEIQAKQKQK